MRILVGMAVTGVTTGLADLSPHLRCMGVYKEDVSVVAVVSLSLLSSLTHHTFQQLSHEPLAFRSSDIQNKLSQHII